MVSAPQDPRDFQTAHFLSFQVNLLKCLGMWPINFKRFLPENLHKLNVILNGVFFMMMSGNLFQMALLQIITLFVSWSGDLDDVSDYIISSIIYTGGFLMCIYYQLRYEMNRGLVEHVNKTFHRRSPKGLTFVTMQRSFEYARKLSMWWAVVCVLGTIHYGIYPLLVWKRILPISIKYPFDTVASPNFELVYVLQFIGQLQIGAIYSVYGTMWISIIILICGQFDLLFCSVKNILWSAMLLRGDELSIKRLREVQEEFSSGSVKSESSSISYYISVEMSEDIRFENWRSKVSEFGDSDSSWNYDQEMLIVLRRAVLLHHNILRMSAMLEEFFSPFMLGKTSVCCLLSCFLAYLSSSGLGSIMKVVTLLEYLMLVFAELLLNTYFPTSLMYQSTKFPEAVMNSPWMRCGPSVRKVLLIMMSNTMKPIVFTAGKIFRMNLDLCASTLKASFSYYTLLKKLQ